LPSSAICVLLPFMPNQEPLSLADRFCRLIDMILADLAAQGFVTAALLFMFRGRIERLKQSFAAMAAQMRDAALSAAPIDAAPIAPDRTTFVEPLPTQLPPVSSAGAELRRDRRKTSPISLGSGEESNPPAAAPAQRQAGRSGCPARPAATRTARRRGAGHREHAQRGRASSRRASRRAATGRCPRHRQRSVNSAKHAAGAPRFSTSMSFRDSNNG
jgi:hypothetical protein